MTDCTEVVEKITGFLNTRQQRQTKKRPKGGFW